MRLYKSDVKVIENAIMIHDSMTSKMGGCDFYNLTVKDKLGVVIGTVENDKHGTSSFVMSGNKRAV